MPKRPLKESESNAKQEVKQDPKPMSRYERLKLRLLAAPSEHIPKPATEQLPDLSPNDFEQVHEAKPVTVPTLPHRPPRREVTSVSPTGIDPQQQPKEVTIRLTRIIPPAPPRPVATSAPAIITVIVLVASFTVGVLSVVGGAWGVVGTICGLVTGGIIHRWYSKGEQHG